MQAGVIAPGEVDERDIREVEPADLAGFAQCHFFAGIGVWSHALRGAGWPDGDPVWTGSCPCQSFSASGQRGGFSDPRHLWPAWFQLIRKCRPGVVFGEQVASKDGLAWLDVVSSDLEDGGYAVGPAVLGAAWLGAPHIRNRLWFVADAEPSDGRAEYGEHGDAHRRSRSGRRGEAGGLADTAESRRAGARQHGGGPSSLPARSEQCGADGELGESPRDRRRERRTESAGQQRRSDAAEPSGHGELGDPECRRLGRGQNLSEPERSRY